MADIAKTVLPGIDRAIERGVADRERLGVMGHSYGGYSTYALIVQTTRFKAAVASAGNANLLSEYLQLGKDGGSFGIGWAETGQGRMAGTPWQYRERYVENSPPLLVRPGHHACVDRAADWTAASLPTRSSSHSVASAKRSRT